MDGYGLAWGHVQWTRRRIRGLRAQTGLLWWSLLPPWLAWGFVLAEHVGDHAASGRAGLRAGLLLSLALWGLGALGLVLRGLFWRSALPGERETALLLGRGDDEIRDRLLNGLQVMEEARRSPGRADPGLVAASLDQVLPRLESLDLHSVLPVAPRRRALAWGAGAWVLALALFLLGGESARLAAARLWDPARDFRGAPLFSLKLSVAWPDSTQPGRVLEGQSLDLRVEALGAALPSEIELQALGLAAGSARGEDAVWRLPLRLGRATLAGLAPRGSWTLRASALEEQLGQVRRLESPPLEIVWLRPPRLDSLGLRLHPPSYTGLPVRGLAGDAADFSAPVGSRLELAAWSRDDLRSVWLQEERTDSTRAPARTSLALERGGARGSWTVTRSLRWSLRLEDGQGLQNPQPLVHVLEALPDQPPRLRVLAPRETEGRLDPSLALDLALLAEDDYGFGPLRLAWKVLSRNLRELTPPPDPATLDSIPRDWGRRTLALHSLQDGGAAADAPALRRAALEERWDLAGLQLLPDDELVFFFELWDNDGWSGPKVVRSPLYRFRMPGLEELFAETRQDEQDIEQEAADVLQQARENTKRLEELREELRRDPELTWERQQRLKEVVREQEQVAQRAGELAAKLDATQQKLDSRNLLSEELRNKLEQLKNLLNEVMSPELLEKLRKAAEQALQNPGPQPAQRPQADMEEVLRKMEQQLDRFLAVLEQMKLEQRLEELARRAEALLEQQRQLQESLQQGEKPQSKSAEEAARREDAEQLARELESLQDEFGKRSSFPHEAVEQARRQLKNKQIPPRLGEMQQQLEGGQSPSQASQESMDQDLNELAEQLQQALQQSRQQSMAELGQEIERLCQELLVISQRQEAISGRLSGLNSRSAQLPVLAEETLENQLGVRAAARGVYELTRKSLHIPTTALTELGLADRSLDEMLAGFHERQTGRLGSHSPDAMARVNLTILLLKEAERQMASSSSSSGLQEMMEKMAQAASRQQCLNGQCNNLMGMKPGQSNKPMSISFGEAKGEQGSIRESLESMQEKLGDKGKPQLGDLGQTAADMKEVEKDLAAQTYTERTKKLQERIVSRLLDAQRSVRRQDEEKKRESRSAQPLRAAAPPPVELQRERALERDLQRALQGGYRPEMQELIRDYFRALEEPSTPPATP